MSLVPAHLPAQHAPHTHGGGAQPKVQYVANQGQWEESVVYKASFPASAMFLQHDGVTWSRMQDDAPDLVHEYIQWTPEEQASFTLRGHAWRMRFVEANPAAAINGEDRRTEYHNYFIGDDPAHWASAVPVFESVHYADLWPGIDLRWHSAEAQVKYDLMIAAGADEGRIGFAYEGLDEIYITREGNVLMRTSVGDVVEQRPVAWYADDLEPIECAFVMHGRAVGFHFPKGRDVKRAVIIDPLLMGATYSGQVGASNYGHCATYDEAGNIYGGAQNFGVGFPTSLGAFQTAPAGGAGTDIVVNKFTPDATTLIWATYVGSPSDDKPHSMIVNSANELCFMGSSTGTGFPTTNGCYDATHNGGSDIVVVHLNATATALVGSTYIGGAQEDGRQNLTTNYGDTYRGEIMLDAADNIYVASSSRSADFPATAGAFQTTLAGGQDAVVFALNPNCSTLLMSTFLGGATDDNGLGLRLDGLGGLYVCGGTTSADFPMVAGGYQGSMAGGPRDGYVVKLTVDGSSVQAGTFFGTSGTDVAYFIDLDNSNDVYIYGQTTGSVPITPAGIYGQANGGIFIAQFDPSLATSIFTTALGASMAPVAFLVDVCEHIYISGYNPNGTWETTPDALYQQSFSQFYLAAYDVDMAGLLFGTYYGGSHVDGGTSRFDKDGVIYQGVCSGGQSMPTTPTAYAPTNNVSWDLGIFKIDFQVAGVNAAGASTLNTGCAPVQIDFSNTSTGTEWVWDFGDGSPPVEEFEPSHTYSTPGAFTVMMIAMDSLSCNLADTTYLQITIGEQQPIDAAFTWEQTVDCTVMEIATENQSTGNPLAWFWDMGDGTQYTDTNVVHQFPGPGSYLVQLIASDPTGCSDGDTVQVQMDIGPPLQVEADFSIVEDPGCDEMGVTCTDQSIGVAPSYAWDMGDGTLYDTPVVDHLFQGVGTYTITLIVTDTNTCNLADTLQMDVTVDPSVPVTAAFDASQAFDCADLLLQTDNQSTGTNLVFDWQLSDGAQYADTNVTHVFSGPGTYTITLNVSDALGCSPPQSASLDVVIDPLEPVAAAFTASQVGNCLLLDVATVNQSTGDSVSYSWDMGDGTVIDDVDVQHSYTEPGIYTITLTLTDLGCGQDDQATMQVEMIDVLPVVYAGDTAICPDDVAVLDVQTDPGFSVLWNTGDTTQSIAVDVPGTYTIVVSDGLCTGTTSIDVVLAPRHQLYDSLFACPDTWVDLEVPIAGRTFQWATGSHERDERVWGAGLYTYNMIDLLGCPHSDSLRVVALDSVPQIFAPNAFTPDGDGRNDVFRIAGFGERTVKMTIFNRWGEQLWANEGMEPFWDGRYSGSIVQDGVYVYLLKYTGTCNNEEKERIGHVTVVR